jgi:hypothetical protein
MAALKDLDPSLPVALVISDSEAEAFTVERSDDGWIILESD